MSGVLKGATEENVITLLCWNELRAKEIAYRITPRIFSVRHYSEIAEVAIRFIERFGQPPRGHLMDLLEDKVRRGDKTAQLMRLTLEQMEMVQADLNTDYVMAELDQFIRQQRMLEDLDKAMDLARGGALDEASNVAIKASFRTSVGFSGGIRLNDREKMLELLEAPDEIDNYFTSGIEALDARGIRPAPKTLIMLMGTAKSGKSWWLVQVGKENILHRKNVLHISLENSQEMTARRYIQALAAMTDYEATTLKLKTIERDGDEIRFNFNSFSGDALSSENRSRIESHLRAIEHRGQLIIKEFPTGSLTVPQLGAYLDYLQQQENFVPDVLMIDYIDLMEIDAANHRIDTGRVTRDVRGLCVARGIAGVSVTQVNRAGSDANLVRATHVSEDWSKVQTADIVLTYNQTPREREKRFARILVAAARNAADKYIILITQAYEIGQFCLDSMFFSNDVEKAWKEELDPSRSPDAD